MQDNQYILDGYRVAVRGPCTRARVGAGLQVCDGGATGGWLQLTACYASGDQVLRWSWSVSRTRLSARAVRSPCIDPCQVPSKRFAFLTIFRVHNETMNIWTHLVGFLMFVWFTVLFASEIGCVGTGHPGLRSG